MPPPTLNSEEPIMVLTCLHFCVLVQQHERSRVHGRMQRCVLRV